MVTTGWPITLVDAPVLGINRFGGPIPPAEKGRIVELALERPDLSSRELACHIVDNEGCRAAGAVRFGVYRLPYSEKSGLSDDSCLPANGSG